MVVSMRIWRPGCSWAEAGTGATNELRSQYHARLFEHRCADITCNRQDDRTARLIPARLGTCARPGAAQFIFSKSIFNCLGAAPGAGC